MRSLRVLGLSDDELRDTARDAGLALRADELRSIASELGRDPSMVEVHAFDAQWSEHCSYKSSRHLLRRLPAEGPTVMLGPGEDAGIVHLGSWNGDRYGVVIAHESHNHPSQVVPYEGAATGVGGIVRDVLCMGAEVIAVGDPLRLGCIDDPDSHQRYVAQGVVDGIGGYGNPIGIPNLAGDVYFDEGFDENCLVNVVALGLVKEHEIIHSKAPRGSAGWDIVLVGKATDTSGFGGAAFSSVTLDETDEDANKGAVQVPDPFLKNVVMRASYRVFAYLRENGITAGFKDLGAGGIMGCTAEICASGGFGAIIDLDDVNVAVENMLPEVIAVGETQERLCWVLPPHATADVLRIYNETFTLPEIARGARAVVIGAVQDQKQYVLRHGGEVVMDVPIEFLTGSVREEHAVRERTATKTRIDPATRFVPDTSESITELLRRVLAHRDVCSREPLYRRYDRIIRGTSVIARGHADAGVMAPIHGSPIGVALGVAGNPRYSKVDAYFAAQHAAAEAVRDVVAVGARPLGLTDCLNFGNPRNIEHYSELVAAIDGLALAARELGTPFVSGNVSLYNESASGRAIPASPIIACVGALHDVSNVVTMGLKRADSALFVIGALHNAMGGSVAAELLGVDGGPLPPLDYEHERRRIDFMLDAADRGVLRAAHAIGNGGALKALAEMVFASGTVLGVTLWGANAPTHLGRIERYFTESGGWVIEVESPEAVVALAKGLGVSADSYFQIGQTTGDATFEIDGERIGVETLRNAWRAPLAEVYP